MNLTQLEYETITTNRFANLLGLKLVSASKEQAVAELFLKPEHFNPIGSVHGGCIFTLADNVAGIAAFSTGKKMTTVDSNIHYLRPAINCEKIMGWARILKQGKRISVIDVDITDENKTVLATATFTFSVFG